jgi:hypothetical protein
MMASVEAYFDWNQESRQATRLGSTEPDPVASKFLGEQPKFRGDKHHPRVMVRLAL